MLIVSRQRGESIVIGNDITLTVVEIRGDKIRLGVTAPSECPVHRQEIYEAIHGRPDSAIVPVARSLEERALLEGIREDPSDETRRLVYADWLEERGDPLGEFIRIQCLQRQYDRRARALWAEHGETWRSLLPANLWL